MDNHNSFKIESILYIKPMNILFLDTEPNGLPPMKNRSYVNPKKVKKYNEARVIEMNWMIMGEDQQKIKSNKNKINE